MLFRVVYIKKKVKKAFFIRWLNNHIKRLLISSSVKKVCVTNVIKPVSQVTASKAPSLYVEENERLRGLVSAGREATLNALPLFKETLHPRM
jgi:hypothetical protein